MSESDPAARRRIIFVHGRKPKPSPRLYRPALWQCLVEGVRRADPAAAASLDTRPEVFQLAYWADLFYADERDFGLDREAIDRLLKQTTPSDVDRDEARNPSRRLKRLIYSIGDRYPWLVQLFADQWIRETLADTRRYLEDRDGLGTAVRERVMRELEVASAGGERLMIMGHSLGSVIVFDALWELTHVHGTPLPVEWFVTLGSPLGTRFIQKDLLGHGREGAERFPRGIRHWRNFTTQGDVAALDPDVADDYRPMLELGLLESLADHEERIYGSFRNAAGLNVHRSYGYLVQPAVGRIIATWLNGSGLREEED